MKLLLATLVLAVAAAEGENIAASLLAASFAVAASHSCFDGTSTIMVDMHDGDNKKVTIAGEKLTIVPAKNNQTWKVETKLDTKFCNASIDFRVPGKPGSPPCAITGTFWDLMQANSRTKKAVLALEFTDPTGQLDKDPTKPINMWIAHSAPSELLRTAQDGVYSTTRSTGREFLGGLIMADLQEDEMTKHVQAGHARRRGRIRGTAKVQEQLKMQQESEEDSSQDQPMQEAVPSTWDEHILNLIRGEEHVEHLEAIITVSLITVFVMTVVGIVVLIIITRVRAESQTRNLSRL